MKKAIKWMTGLAVVGAAIGACAYLANKKAMSGEDFSEDTLDSLFADKDQMDTAGRNYVTLNQEDSGNDSIGDVEETNE